MVISKYFFIKSTGRYFKVRFEDIICVEGCKNYIRIVTENKSYLVLFSMKSMERFLPSSQFRRIHKSFIVSLDKIISFDSENVYLQDRTLPIGLQYKNELEKSVVIITDSVLPSDSEVTTMYTIPLVNEMG